MWGSAEEQIRSLQHSLYTARRAIVTLVPQRLRSIAEAYHDFKTDSDLHKWERRLVDESMEMAEILKPGRRLLPRATRILSTVRSWHFLSL